MSKSMVWTLEPPAAGAGRRARVALAKALKWGSERMERAALRVHGSSAVALGASEPVFEFYAEAGAPEGALYVDGVRVGIVPGVTRL